MPSDFDRSRSLERLANEEFDVLVVGGGITGAGCALDAASRGLRTALVERRDFAFGTSSRSSKLVHGGLRYLQRREIRLVYESLAEREVLRRNAPHLVRILPFLLPIFRTDGLVTRRQARAMASVMWAYDLAGGMRIGRTHERLSATEVLGHMPSLRADRVAGGFLYYDAQADDARLTLAVARTAAEHGAAMANYVELVRIDKRRDGRVDRVIVSADGAELAVRARAIVNATGVWADDVRELDELVHRASIRPAKGVHITVPSDRLAVDVAVVLPVSVDRRSIFVVPWGEVTYVGTTDTDFDGQVDDPLCNAEDVGYLLQALSASVTSDLTHDDVRGTWAGLRPLVREPKTARTADLSRRHVVHVSPSAVVTITGGKLTTYRRMAGDAVDRVAELLDRRSHSVTKRLRLIGAERFTEGSDHLVSRYGGEAAVVKALAASDPTLARPVVPGLPYLAAEVVFAARREMARTVDDVLTRRTRARLMARDASADAAAEVARLMAGELGWSDRQRDAQTAAYRASVERERAASRP